MPRADPLADYLALRAKVDSFARGVAERRDDLTCRSGCSGCCHVRLEVSDVEADALRRALQRLVGSDAGRAALSESLARSAATADTCVLLDEDGRCLAYEARPLVCRTQGLPLRYPADTVPVEALSGRAAGGDVTWCPLNFRERRPEPEDVLDAERVDVMLGLVNAKATSPGDRLRRTSIESLARAAVERSDAEAR